MVSPRPTDTAAILAGTEILSQLPRRSIAALAQRCRRITAAKGCMLFKPGDTAAVYTLQRGRVAILARPEPGDEIQLFVRGVGELFGETSLWFDRQINEARTLEQSMVLRIEAGAFRSELEGSQPASLALAGLMARRLAAAEGRVGEVAVHSVKTRLLRVFERLTAGAPIEDALGDFLLQRLTHDELATIVGASRVAVSHALSVLQRNGRILIKDRRIILRRQESRS